MRVVKYPLTLGIKISEDQRRKIEQIAECKQISLGEAARSLIDVGIKAKGTV
jgi:hypothetical protein